MRLHYVKAESADADRLLHMAEEAGIAINPAPTGECGAQWDCPGCGTVYDLFDGDRIFGHPGDCTCPTMPSALRAFRALREVSGALQHTQQRGDS
jgi:hypothetical protein